jgi:multiple sugar transport system permease protein
MQALPRPTDVESTPARRPWSSRRVQEKKDWKAGLWALLFLGPNLILFLMFTAYPVGYGLYISLYNYSVLRPKRWVGLDNYDRFIHHPETPDLIKRSIYYAVGAQS